MMFDLFFTFLSEHGKKFRLRVVLVLLSSTISAALEVVGVALLYPLITVAINPEVIETSTIIGYINNFFGFEHPTQFLVFLAMCIGASFILKNLYMLLQQQFQFNLVRDWRVEICSNLMRSYIQAPLKFHLRNDSSTVISNLTTVVSRAVNSFLIQIIMMCSNIIVCGALIVILLIQYPSASILTGLLVVGLLFIQMKVIRRATKTINERYVKANTKTINILTMALAGVKDTKLLGKEDVFIERYNNNNVEVSELDKKNMLVQYIPIYLSEAVLMVGIIAFVSYVLVTSENPTAGVANMAVLAAIAIRIAPMINRVLYCYSQIRSSTNSIETILDEFSIVKDDSDNFKNRINIEQNIEFNDVCFSYDEGKEIGLKNVNIKIDVGEFIGIVGKSGSGKTTFVDLLSGLLKIDSGEVSIDGRSFSRSDYQNIRNEVSYVSQSPFMINNSLKANIAFGVLDADIDHDRVLNSAKSAGLEELVDSRGIDFLVGEQGKNLSGGQRQRVAIARALYFDRQIIVLDEATSALDAKTENNIANVIASLKGKRTIVVVAHRLSTLKQADSLILFDNGSIKAQGSFEELCHANSEFSEMVALSRF